MRIPRASPLPIVGQASVIDADTIEILRQRIRLFGIGSPEDGQTCQDAAGEAYRCGQVGALALDQKMNGRSLSCIQKDIDQYKRIVAVCSAGGDDLNARLVSEGHAVTYREFSNDYVDEEQAAEAAARGFWAGTFTNPAEYPMG